MTFAGCRKTLPPTATHKTFEVRYTEFGHIDEATHEEAIAHARALKIEKGQTWEMIDGRSLEVVCVWMHWTGRAKLGVRNVDSGRRSNVIVEDFVRYRKRCLLRTLTTTDD